MIKHYLKVAWRSLSKNKFSTVINIGGLSVGMTVAILIGLWIWDELTFDRYNPHYNRIAQVMQHQTANGRVKTQKSMPIPLAEELRKTYGSNFKYIVLQSWTPQHILATPEKQLDPSGCFMQEDGPELYGLTMVAGSRTALKDPSAILLSRSLAKALFGGTDPLNKTVRLDNQAVLFVAGIYDDPPANSTIGAHETAFIASWNYYANNVLARNTWTNWQDNSWQLFVELSDEADMATVSAKIKDSKLNRLSKDEARFKPVIFLHPMSKWHLYSVFKNGVLVGGNIQNVWLFGLIGFFVLLLACINFMNLSTARSEKRAKEVGIRKTIGSLRGQLIGQFFCESILVALFAFAFALLLAGSLLPWFNDVADKHISILWGSPVFWALGLGVTLLTGIIAGSYPALYLSSFRPIKVLKGSFRAGRFASVPRQVLVVLQFTVSVVLIIGTIVVFRQIEFARNRPVGYSRDGLVNIEMQTDDLPHHLTAVKTDLLKSGVVTAIAESSSPATGVDNNTGGISWKGKDPAMAVDFANISVSSEYGRTVGWQFVAGRDFSPQLLTDSNALILNETAVSYMGLTNPVGEVVKFWDHDYRVIGVISDVVMENPYEPVKQAIYHLSSSSQSYLNIRINPNVNAHAAIDVIEKVCKVYAPAVPFSYRFVDEQYAKKFANEERIGKLAGVFAGLAVFISCLGLFGMASFMAEQRIKEIGVRKVLGASVVNLWGLLSRDFIVLVVIALVIALPAAWYFMHSWLQHYTYRTGIGWWIFAVVGMGAILVTMLTVSYQSIRAALANPVKSLRSE